MPCFQGFAISIHTPDGPIPEYGVQQLSRHHRISSYIPVPSLKINQTTGLPDPSTFAISITLLTPSLPIPYAKPVVTRDHPWGIPKVAGSPGMHQYGSGIAAYQPLTSSPTETVAAYIHFDGRKKEEVATLLRRGVETWVNSRWVSTSDAQGGLAEREFLFKEVGLERWLNGLDLIGQSKDAAYARIQRRKERLEKKQRKHSAIKQESSDDDEPGSSSTRRARPVERVDAMRYGDNGSTEDILGKEDRFLSDDSSEDEMPEPQAAGQITISLFRVLASGEVKKGEYSPAFDAHDEYDGADETNGDGDADVDHTTSLAQPKTLDPKTISTQTVTGIDPPDKPYAVFSFFYRGEKQLRKMGIMPPLPESAEQKPGANGKRRSRQLDFTKLEPLKSSKGTMGFSTYRDAETATPSTFNINGAPSKKSKSPRDMESDDDDDADERKRKIPGADNDRDDVDTKVELSKEELARRSALAEGVQKMKLKRVHSSANVDTFVPTLPSSPESDHETEPASETNKAKPLNGSASSPTRFSTSLPAPREIMSDPGDTTSPRASKKHRASNAAADDIQSHRMSNGFIPSSITNTINGNTSLTPTVPATPAINGLSPSTNKLSADILLNSLMGGPEAPPPYEEGAQREWVKSFVGGGGESGADAVEKTARDLIAKEAAQTALPDEDMDAGEL